MRGESDQTEGLLLLILQERGGRAIAAIEDCRLGCYAFLSEWARLLLEVLVNRRFGTLLELVERSAVLGALHSKLVRGNHVGKQNAGLHSLGKGQQIWEYRFRHERAVKGAEDRGDHGAASLVCWASSDGRTMRAGWGPDRTTESATPPG